MIHDEVLNFHDWILRYHEPFPDKIRKLKSLKLAMGLWHLNNMKVILTLWTLNYVGLNCAPVSGIDSFHIVHIRANSFNKILFLKNMIKPPLIWLMYLPLYPNFQITVRLMKSKGCVPLLNILHKNLWINQQSMSMIDSFSPFDIKCKKKKKK